MTVSIQTQIVELLEEIQEHEMPFNIATLLEGVFQTFSTTAYASEMLAAFFSIHKPTAKGSGYMDMRDWANDSAALNLDNVGTSYWVFRDGSMFYLNAYIEGAVNP